RCLEQETDYRLTITGPQGTKRVKQGAALTDQQQAQMASDVYAAARDKFQFLYDSQPMSNEGEPYRDSAHYLAGVCEFLNGPAFLQFCRRVTGMGAIQFTEAQATRYGRGHFLSTHDDDDQGKSKRLAAYVLNMTPGWRADWGGVLMFPDKQGNIERGYSPAYNALNIFRVPRLHMVSMVMPFAAGGRYAVTGWLRAR
ncbi:MAG TPA: 2OG-Fe(II) oxygenase family protein, partial [Rhizomicrobium sp.]|nr:2OG-Fe(II) oxygenase family protein [Rhizomicrobium sp.]